MHDSKTTTCVVTQIPNATPPAGGVQAVPVARNDAKNAVPVRVMIRNVSENGAYVLISYDMTTLQAFPAPADSYKLPAGQRDVFYLKPGEKLYAASPSPDATVSVATSDALPLPSVV